MPARAPEIYLSSDDRRLLELLARLVADDEWTGDNIKSGQEVAISDREAGELLLLLEQFSASRQFVEGAHFTELLFSDRLIDDEPAREIYLASRKRRGRSRALASTHWQEFLVRIGLSNNRGGYWRAAPSVQARRMDIQKFLTLERALIESTGLHPRVQSLILRSVAAKTNSIDMIRNGEAQMPKGSLTQLPKRVAQEIQASRAVGVKPMSTQKMIGLMTIVSDISVLFTTRDWNVVGTISSMAGALVAVTE
jgi:hypothetical protein